MKVSPDFIARGALISLESAHYYLRDANQLYKKRRYPSACVLAAIAIEHLGLCQLLLEEWYKARDSACNLNCRELNTRLKENHERMLKRGLVAFLYRLPASVSELAKELFSLKQGTPQYDQLAKQVGAVYKKMQDRLPSKYFNSRVRAQYVEPLSECARWNRPAKEASSDVHEMLSNAGISYRVVLYVQVLKQPELADLMAEMGLKTTLTKVRSTWPPPEAN